METEDWARVFTVDGKQALFQRYYDEEVEEELPYKIKITTMLDFAKCEIRTDYATEESRDSAWLEVSTSENAKQAIQVGLNMFK